MQFLKKSLLVVTVLFAANTVSKAQYFVQGERANAIGAEYRIYIPVVENNKQVENAYGFGLNYKRSLFEKGELGLFAGLNWFKNTKPGPSSGPSNVDQAFKSVGITFDYYLLNSAEIRIGAGLRAGASFFNLDVEELGQPVEEYDGMYLMGGLRFPIELKVSQGFYFVVTPEAAYSLALSENMTKSETISGVEVESDYSLYGIDGVIFANLNFGFRVNF